MFPFPVSFLKVKIEDDLEVQGMAWLEFSEMSIEAAFPFVAYLFGFLIFKLVPDKLKDSVCRVEESEALVRRKGFHRDK